MTTGDLFEHNKYIFGFGQIQFATWVSAGVVQPSPSYWVQLTESSDLPTHLLSLQTLRHTRRRKRGERGKGGQEKSNGDSPIKINLHLEAFGIWRGWSLHRRQRKKLGKNAADWYWVALPSSLRSCCNKGSLQFVQPGPFLMLHKSGRDS